MVLAMYSYLGYYNVCYIGDEVRDPGRTIPRSILLSALLVVAAFRRPAPGDARHGVVAQVPTDETQAENVQPGRDVHGAISTARGAGRSRW